jgi:hypothetical protein
MINVFLTRLPRALHAACHLESAKVFPRSSYGSSAHYGEKPATGLRTPRRQCVTVMCRQRNLSAVAASRKEL